MVARAADGALRSDEGGENRGEMDRGGAHERDDAGESGERSEADPACPTPAARRGYPCAAARQQSAVELALDDAGAALTPDQRRWLIDAATRAVDAALRQGPRKAPTPLNDKLMREPDAPASKEHEARTREGASAHSVRVRIVDADVMASLHERVMGIAEPTDVLTFDLRETQGANLDADIVVCADVAREQARRLGFAIERELLLYILHGALHCMGCDDHDAADARRMHAREDEALERIGVGAVYRNDGASAKQPATRSDQA